MSFPSLESIAPGIMRLPCPMRRFTAVNGWVIGAPGRQAIVDTGMPGDETLALWVRGEAEGLIAGVEAVICTHMHRDHSGQAKALMTCHRAPLFMGALEHARLLAASMTTPEQGRARLRQFFHLLGLPAALIATAEPIDYTMLAPFPAQFTSLTDDMTLELGGEKWRVLLGGGHSPMAACLLSAQETYLLAGDQILPGSGPHITVGAVAPEADPLTAYFSFLDRLKGLPDSLLVLPGHGAPFTGLAGHVANLEQNHRRRLGRVLAGLEGAQSCAEMARLAFSERAAERFGDLLPGMTLALANHLWQAGQLRRHVDDAGVYRFERIS